MDYCLIQVPYHAGDDRHPSCAGPGRLVEAGAADLLAAPGGSAMVATVDRYGPFRDTASTSAVVNRAVAAKVGAAHAAGRLPVVLTGSCVTSHGVLAGFDHSECAAVWLDAHADFNTADTTVSGFFPGMALAVITGHCYGSYWAEIGNAVPLPEDAVALFGVRALSPEAERERLRRSAIHLVEWRDGRPQGNVGAALAGVAARARGAYLHIDLDCFAPETAPGVVDEPVPGGLSGDDAEAIIRATAAVLQIRAVTLATYNPALDPDERTLRLALRLIQLLGEVTATNSAGG
ncbi:MAG TPA: arginase family protein [Jiangellaceae bacterium]|nr:arginase family protein [Jiangellaceae bacterium]